MAREPWIKLKVGTGTSEKLAELPDDSARWGYIRLLLAAKTQRRMGVFVNRALVEDVLGRHGAYLDAWLGVGLIHIAPALCEGCAGRHAQDQLRGGEVVVHDYLREQRDPTMPDRVDTFRKLQAAVEALAAAGIPIPFTDGVTADVTLRPVTTPEAPTAPPAPVVTPDSVTSPPPEHPAADVTANVTPLSRARGMTVTVTERETVTTKKNVPDGDVVEASPAREADDAPFLSDPNRARRPRAATPRGIQMPPTIESLTPRWLHPCTDYVRHTSRHRLVDGVAVCDACEDKLAEGTPAAAPPINGAAQEGLGLV